MDGIVADEVAVRSALERYDSEMIESLRRLKLGSFSGSDNVSLGADFDFASFEK
jgi:hypothetical protein